VPSQTESTFWEYLTTPLLIHNTAAILNNWGSDGWELVQVVTGPEGGLVAYLKRRRVVSVSEIGDEDA